MNKILLLTILLLIQASVYAQSKKISTFQFTEKRGNHTALLVFRTGAFERSKHKITYGKQLDLTVLEVDGRMALGVDGNIPRVEIQSLDFYFDGKKIVVPKRLYSDLYEPNLEKGNFAIKLGDDGNSLLAFMAGSDAAGGYQVIWVLRKDGRHSRFSTPCSDCDYRGFLSFFVDQFAR
ncbi:MAG TPA: hypothetical protein VE732_05500 [Nitrososphaera sp.]|nr:hypothetical protein [Nitrososphaera sp.]